ncbi:MAG TPA: LysR family transcriptional regulator [Chloroflexota bacterium]|nr:LysR family transcriptional regulator [Chloroflexota bacterium]
MELHHLRYFVAIAERLSFSAAAGDLDVSQPALSRQMRDLERELGAPLFNREGRRISLTAAGEALLPPARSALLEAERGRRNVRDVLGARGGSLLIGSSPQTAATVLAPLLRDFQDKHPAVEVRVLEDGALGLIALLNEGKLDLAVVPLDVPRPLTVAPFLTARILAVAPAGHPMVRAATIDLRDLVAPEGAAPIPLLLLKESYLTRLRLAAAWHEAGLHPYVAMESAVGQTLAAYAEAGLGVAILPETVDLRGFTLGASVVVDHDEPVVLRNGLGWNPRRYLSPAARAFIDLVQATLVTPACIGL